MATAPAPDRLWSLQLGRAVAALMVLLFHAGASAAYFSNGMPEAATAALSYGRLGVDFFFVLSGFIIYHVNRHKAPGPAWQRDFAVGRLVRIYLPYLPVGIGVAFAYTLLPTMSAGSRSWGWLPTLTLLPAGEEPALLVAWTLTCELVFYFVFWLSFRLGRPLTGVALWAGASMAWALIGGYQRAPVTYLLGPMALEFLFGMLAVRLLDMKVPGWLLLAGAAAAFGGFAMMPAEPAARVLVGLGVALLLVPLVRADRRGKVQVPAFGRLLGDASYSIYLVHVPLTVLLARVAPPYWAAALVVLTLAGAAGGLLNYFLYERPVLKLARAALRRPRPRDEAVAGGVLT